MIIPENLVTFIVESAKEIHHGRIIIELNATSEKIDVITESRERFFKNKEERDGEEIRGY